MTDYIRSGWGFSVDVNFARAVEDMPIELDTKQFAGPGQIIGYITGDPNHPLNFMRPTRIRVCVDQRALTTK